MRKWLAAAVLCVGALVPKSGNAQALQRPAPAPQATAAAAEWQLQGEPITYAGGVYYPTGPGVFFDGGVMVRVDTYRGVPVYVDASVDAYSVVYVPVGGGRMRPYERRRDGELAGTVGNRTPSFPVQRDGESPAAMATALDGMLEGARAENAPGAGSESAPRAVGTSGTATPRPTSGIRREGGTMIAQARPTIVESIPQPRRTDGIWIQFGGARWHSAGAAVPYSADRFTPVGTHHGFAVYRENGGAGRRIFVSVVKDGPLAPFER